MITKDDVIQSSLKMINGMTHDMQQDLIQSMRNNTALFVEVCFPHVLMEQFFHERDYSSIEEYLKGNLERSTYMPEIHNEMYSCHNALFNDDADAIAEVVFRGGAKTTIKNLCNIKNICYCIFDVVGLISETKDQAKYDLLTIADELENNPILRRLFGKFEMVRNAEYTKIFMHPVYKVEIVYIATGMNGRIRGMNYKKRRPKLVCVDDFESETNSLTPGGRDKVQRTVNSKILNLGDYKYAIAFYGTIVHHETFLAMARQMPLFTGPRGRYIECRISDSPSIVYDSHRNRHVVVSIKNFKIGKPSWPQRYSQAKIAKRMQHYQTYRNGEEFWQFLQELYNIPKTDTNPIFDPDALIEIDGTYERYQDISYISINEGSKIRKIPILVFDGIDPAAGRELKNDRTVKFTAGVTPSGNWIVLDVDARRIGFDEQRNMAVKSYIKYRPEKICIESFGTQLSFYNSVVDLFRKKNLYASFKKYNRTSISKGNKFKQYLIPIVNGGQVSYLKGCRNIEIFIAELAAFTHDANEHDDTLDGFYLCVDAAGKRKPNAIDIDAAIRNAARKSSTFGTMRQKSVQNGFAKSFYLN